MIKIITKILFLSSILITANATNNYTYVFTSTSNIDNAKSFINKYLQNNTHNLYIVKYKDRYRVSYGAFDNRVQAKYFEQNLPSKIKNLDKFLVKNSFDLDIKSSNVLEVIKSKKTLIQIDEPRIIKPEVIKKTVKEVAKKRIVKTSSNPVKKVEKKIDNRFKNYTYVFSSMSTLKNAKSFVSKYLKNHKENIYIIKYNKRYRVAYGAFNNRKEAYSFKKFLPINIKKMDNFLVKNNFDLNKDTKNVLEIIRVKEKKELIEKILLEQKKKGVLITKEDIQKIKPLKIKVKNFEKKKEKDKKPKKKITKEEKAVLTRENKSKITYGIDTKLANLDIKNNFVYGQNGNNFSIKNKNIVFIPKIFLNYEKHTILASYLRIKDNSSKTLSSDLTFAGEKYNAGNNINSSYKTNWFITGYRYEYKNAQIGADIHDYANKFNINDSEVRRDFLFPAVAFDMKNYFREKYNILYGASFGLNSEMSYYDYYLGFGINDVILANSNLSIGYKSKNFDISDNTYDGKTSYDSTYFNFKKEF